MSKELEITIEKIADIKSKYSCDLNPSSDIDKHYLQNPVLKEILDNYTIITNPELSGKYLENYQADLKQDIIECFEDSEVEYSIASLNKVAYFRLVKVSNQYSLEKSFSSCGSKLESISQKAKSYKKEYDIVSCLL